MNSSWPLNLKVSSFAYSRDHGSIDTLSFSLSETLCIRPSDGGITDEITSLHGQPEKEEEHFVDTRHIGEVGSIKFYF